MAHKFLELAFTPAVARAQERFYGQSMAVGPAPSTDQLGLDEREFIATRDSFYLSTVSESGWPYVQHRGGKPGFLRVLGPSLLAFADYKGNRQMLSTGNLANNDRAALFLMDYPRRTRLKILGHVRIEDARERPDLVEQITRPDERRLVERVFLIDVVAYDWNCPKYITPRYTTDEVGELVAPLRQRIAELEAQLKTHS